MMTYTDELGNPVTDEQIDEMLTEVEAGDFSNFVPVSDVVYGMIEPNKVPKTTVSFKIPVALQERLADTAVRHKCTKSDLIRAYIVDGLGREAV